MYIALEIDNLQKECQAHVKESLLAYFRDNVVNTCGYGFGWKTKVAAKATQHCIFVAPNASNICIENDVTRKAVNVSRVV